MRVFQDILSNNWENIKYYFNKKIQNKNSRSVSLIQTSKIHSLRRQLIGFIFWRTFLTSSIYNTTISMRKLSYLSNHKLKRFNP